MFTKLLKSKLPQIIAMGNSADPKLVPMKPIQSEASKNWERIKNLKDKIPTLEEVFKSNTSLLFQNSNFFLLFFKY